MDEQQQPSATDGSGTDALHAECQKQLADVDGKWKRAVADYANREKDIAREREEFARFCTVALIRDFLPIVDAVRAAAGWKTPEVDAGGETSERTPALGHRALRRSEERATGKHPVSGAVHEEPYPAVEESVVQQGFRAIQVLLHIFFKRHGVESVGAVGDRVDYLLHEVVGTRVPAEQERGREQIVPGTILEVAQVGYTMHGKLLRSAKVIVCEEKK